MSTKLIAAIVFVLIAVPFGRWVTSRPLEASMARAYQVCGECGLAPDETERLIAGLEETTLTREQALALYRATFEEPNDAELCLPCAEAVVEAAQ